MQSKKLSGNRLPTVTIAPRQHLPLAHGVLLIMSCYDPSRPALGVKFATVRTHAAPPEARVHATYLLLDPETSAPRLSIAANYLTALRTAATSAVATKISRPRKRFLPWEFSAPARSPAPISQFCRWSAASIGFLVCGRESPLHRRLRN